MAPATRSSSQDRMSDQYERYVHLIVSIFTGVALGSGALSILAILSSGAARSVKLSASAMWVATFLAVIGRFQGLMVGSIIRATSPNVVEVLSPFVIGVTEFNMFAVLAPLAPDPVAGEPSRMAQLEHLSWWPVVFGLGSVVACVTIFSTRTHMARTIDRAPADVAPLARWYVARLKPAQIATGVWSLVMAVVFLALRHGPDVLLKWQAVVGAAVACSLVGVVVSQEGVRRMIIASLEGDGGAEQLSAPPSPEQEIERLRAERARLAGLVDQLKAMMDEGPGPPGPPPSKE